MICTFLPKSSLRSAKYYNYKRVYRPDPARIALQEPSQFLESHSGTGAMRHWGPHAPHTGDSSFYPWIYTVASPIDPHKGLKFRKHDLLNTWEKRDFAILLNSLFVLTAYIIFILSEPLRFI